MRATLESLLEDQADFASMSKWIHCGTSYSKKCSSIERIEGSRDSPIGLESASGKRSREFAFWRPVYFGCVSQTQSRVTPEMEPCIREICARARSVSTSCFRNNGPPLGMR